MTTPSVSFVAPSAYLLGGLATWLDELIPALRARGWHVNILLTDGQFHRAEIYGRAHPAVTPALFVRDPTGTGEGRIQALIKVLQACRADAVISVNIPDAMLAVARIKQADPSSSMRAIMSIHGLEPDLFADIEQLTPILDGVICSNRLAQARARLCTEVKPERVRYAPYGTQPQPPQPRRDGGLMTIGFAGRFEHFQKRVQDLAPIAKALLARGIAHRWLIAGDGPDKKSIDALVQTAGLEALCLGHVDAARMREHFYDQCDVLLNASEWETGPIVVWEAMANNVAVVSSTYVGSGREAALQHGENCLLYPIGDIEKAAQCIGELSDAQLRTQLTNAGQHLLASRYTPSISCESWANAIRDLTALPPVMGKPPRPANAGRLDRWFGTAFGYRLRRIAGRSFKHNAPGGEWPHTFNGRARDDLDHWRELKALDRSHDKNTIP